VNIVPFLRGRRVWRVHKPVATMLLQDDVLCSGIAEQGRTLSGY
jgi:hypothetical protein